MVMAVNHLPLSYSDKSNQSSLTTSLLSEAEGVCMVVATLPSPAQLWKGCVVTTITAHSLSTRKGEGQWVAMVITVLILVSDEEVSKGTIIIQSPSHQRAKMPTSEICSKV